MNQDSRSQIATVIRVTARYYGRNLELDVLSAMVDDLIGLPVDEVLRAFKTYRLDAKNKYFPLPSAIISIINPEPESQDLARCGAIRIHEAVVKFGWDNPVDAKAYVGDAAWAVVSAFGGWTDLCKNMGVSIPVTMFIAQARDALQSNLNLQRAGIDTTQPVIEQVAARNSQIDKLQNLIKGTFKQIE